MQVQCIDVWYTEDAGIDAKELSGPNLIVERDEKMEIELGFQKMRKNAGTRGRNLVVLTYFVITGATLVTPSICGTRKHVGEEEPGTRERI